ncbi:MAG: hypothetical protein JXA52_09965, partial [Planctomycetes bacterium]|nr:hypothetical protein [Planctomycetota bacterium]
NAAPEMGGLTGVQMMLYGSVTEFGEGERGGGFSIGMSGFGGGNRASSFGASPQWTKGSIAMDIRIVDTTTGQVIKTFKVRERVSSRGFSASFGMDQVNVGNNFFAQTPLGQAARRCITKAIDKFAEIAAKRPWQGRIVEVDGGTVYINAGSTSGIEVGNVFKVERVTKTFTDPETGQVIGQKKEELGRIEVTEVMDKMSTATYIPLAAEVPQRNDIVLEP